MSTQGLLTLTRNGEVILKAVCGCNGFNVGALAEKVEGLDILVVNEVYRAAKEVRFGCPACLVVFDEDEKRSQDDEGLDLYRETFSQPRFNPRWRRGDGAETMVIRVESLPCLR